MVPLTHGNVEKRGSSILLLIEDKIDEKLTSEASFPVLGCSRGYPLLRDSFCASVHRTAFTFLGVELEGGEWRVERDMLARDGYDG